uniref:Uncharacterized protein n=1 Tax=Glossina brevipalpis TaxID=37001 RepID=A0A1A9WHE2_9MUSC
MEGEIQKSDQDDKVEENVKLWNCDETHREEKLEEEKNNEEPEELQGPLKSDKAVSTHGINSLEDLQRALTYEAIFHSLLEKKMQAMKRDCEERKRAKRLKRKSIGRMFFARKLFSSVESRQSSTFSESAEDQLCSRTVPTSPHKTKSPKTAIRDKAYKHRKSDEIEEASVKSLSQSRSHGSRTRTKTKTTASAERLSQIAPLADDSVVSTPSNSSERQSFEQKLAQRHLLVHAQTHMPTDAAISSSSGESKDAQHTNGILTGSVVPSGSFIERSYDTASLGSGYENGTGARLHSSTLAEGSLTSIRDSIESLSFASSRCTVSFGATEIIPEIHRDPLLYERIRAAKRQRILEAKSISAQCSPELPPRLVLKTMIHPPPIRAIPENDTASSLTITAGGDKKMNDFRYITATTQQTKHPIRTQSIIGEVAVASIPNKSIVLPQNLIRADSENLPDEGEKEPIEHSRDITRQNTSEDSANLTISTLLNQSDSLSLQGSRVWPTVELNVLDKPVTLGDRFKSKSTSLLAALSNGRSRPPPLPPPPLESATVSPATLLSPTTLTRSALTVEQLHQHQSDYHQRLVNSLKSSMPTKPLSPRTASPVSPPQTLHIVTIATSSNLTQPYPVITTSSSAMPIDIDAPSMLSEQILTFRNGTANGAIIASVTTPSETAKLHRMTSTSTGSSVAPIGCCATTKTSTRDKSKQRIKPVVPAGKSGSDDEYRGRKRKYKRYHRCSDPILVYPKPNGLQHCILAMPPTNEPIQYPYSEEYSYDTQLQIESDKNDDLEKIVPSGSTKRRHRKHRHHRHKKRHRHKKPKILVQDLETQEVKVIDPDDLPQRARWTIIATACLLLLMCLMLVGITLRMAPIIDEMAFFS